MKLGVALYRRLLNAVRRADGAGGVPLVHPCPSIRSGNRWGTFSYFPASHAAPERCFERLMPPPGRAPAVAVPSEAAWPLTSRGYAGDSADSNADAVPLPAAALMRDTTLSSR